MVAGAYYLLFGFIGYKVVAFLMLVTLSFLSLRFKIFSILIAGLVSAPFYYSRINYRIRT